ncbi:hypothetical protein BFL38_09825 [Brachyspira hampsonii]|uniref:Lipocalin-like domain-containing protein n=1 Tax=Brachyspira hampsonii TaxID=1287055 RepID=A0A1E5NI01_9SPIR|nr:hypothetical protein [Brachyspira hampsonii]OEJ15756.1 hypothetical protein BFL38_09825 [Brachyspira hampsonii]
MNKKLFLILFILILAGFSAIGCKNNNTNPDTGTDIGEKYQGTWYLNAATKFEFYPDSPPLAAQIIADFESMLNSVYQDMELIINTDGSVIFAGGKIEKNNIMKEGSNKYIITLYNDNVSMEYLIAEKYELTFNADGTGNMSIYIIINVGGNNYNLYLFRDGTITATKQNVQ